MLFFKEAILLCAVQNQGITLSYLLFFFLCVCVFIIIRQDAPLGFLLQSIFVCNGELVNSHNYLTNGA